MFIKLNIILILLVFSFSGAAQRNDLVPLLDSISGKYGYVNTVDSSKYIIYPKFTSGRNFYNNFAIVYVDSLAGLINKKGGYVFKPRYINISIVRHNLIIAQDNFFYIANVFGEPIFEIDAYSNLWQKEIIDKLKKDESEDAELILRVLAMYDDNEKSFKEFMKLSFVYEELQVMILDYFNSLIQEQYSKIEIHLIYSTIYRYTEGSKYKEH